MINAKFRGLRSLNSISSPGQSNMAGRGDLRDFEAKPLDEKVLMLDKNNTLVVASHPLHNDKPEHAGVGPGHEFARQIRAAYPSHEIILVVSASLIVKNQ